MPGNAIVVDSLSKKYQIGELKRPHDTLRDQLAHAVRSRFVRNGSATSDTTLWALNKLSFEVRQGEVIGIIGSNGAGKSTLLKILSRITSPTSGFAEIQGRVASLLEVGTGFHPELTGRENVYLNGAILGMRKSEIDRKFDDIVAFSEMQRFLDTPVKRYSSGMQVRLAFAVASQLEPEVLLVDEVLAVGDIAFQKKCLGRMDTVAREGRTILFVSHNLAAVEHLCQRGIVLQNGRQVFQGPAKEAVQFYIDKVAIKAYESNTHAFDLTAAEGRSAKYRPIIRRIELFTDDDRPLNSSLQIGASLKVHLRLFLEAEAQNLAVAVGFDTLHGQRVFTAHTAFQPGYSGNQPRGYRTYVCEIPSLPFTPGEYKIVVAAATGDIMVDFVDAAARLDVIGSDYYGTGKVPWNGLVTINHRWRVE